MNDERATRNDSTELSRRGFGRAVGVAAVGLAGGGLLVGRGTRPALALEDTSSFVANDMRIETADGSVDSVEFGDPADLDGSALDAESDRIALSWTGFDDVPGDVTVGVEFRGLDDGDENGWDGGTVNETGWEELLSGSVEVGEPSGSEAYTWRSVFGMNVAAVTDHGEIRLEDFEESESGGERTREVEVRVSATADPGGGAGTIGDTKTDTAAVTVSNEDVTPPTIDRFDLRDRSNPSAARLRVEWAVSDDVGLNQVMTEVIDWNSVRTSDVGGSSASGTHDHRQNGGYGEVEVRLTATDTAGNETSDTKTITLTQ